MMMMFCLEGQNWRRKTSSGVGSQNENFCLGGSFNYLLHAGCCAQKVA